MDAGKEADAKSGEDARLDPTALKALGSLVDTLKSDPGAIHRPELQFFKDFLQSWGAKLPEESKAKGEAKSAAPEAKAEETKAEEPEEEEEEEDPEEEDEPEEEDPERLAEDSGPFPEKGPAGVELTDDQMDKQCACKQAAAEALEDGKQEEALQKHTEAIKIGNASAMMYAKRAELLLKMKRPNACIKDCDNAIEVNPDSGKAYRLRGKAHRKLGHWEEAHKDLSLGQKLDFDDDTVEMQKFVADKWKKISEKQTAKRIKQEERARKKREADIKRRKAAAQKAYDEQKKREAEAPSGFPGGFPGMGGMGGMPGMPGMGGMPGMPPGFDPSALFADPEVKAAMENPKVQAALQEMMTNPASIGKYQSDPEVMNGIRAVMSKMGMGGMGGMPGGMGGMPGGMGGMPGGMGGFPGMPGGMGGMPGGMGGSTGPSDTPGPTVEEVDEDANGLD